MALSETPPSLFIRNQAPQTKLYSPRFPAFFHPPLRPVWPSGCWAGKQTKSPSSNPDRSKIFRIFVTGHPHEGGR